MSQENSGVDVGYIEEAESWKLESRFFPSKIGGRPAWLQFSELPSQEDMVCAQCQEPQIFLCQIYAPIESRDDCFHRSLYIFFCRNPKCHSDNNNAAFVVYRSQLKRENEFYPFEPPDEIATWHPECRAEKWTDLCAACGNKGTSHCGRCKKVKYCSRSHQIVHWRDFHKKICSVEGVLDLNGKSSCLLPEFELIVEPESNLEPESGKAACSGEGDGEDDNTDDEDDDDEAEKARIKEFNLLAQEGKIGTLAGDDSVNTDLLKMAASEEDKTFNVFKKRISKNPGQVLRYERNGIPLWLSQDHIPEEADIPPCNYCGSRRNFEFQILPQLLNHLSLDDVKESVDWGTLAVYTCEHSCSSGPAYKTEFLWKQDVIA